jgi:hypothetical protein
MWWYQQLWYAHLDLQPLSEPLPGWALSSVYVFTRGGIGSFGIVCLLCCGRESPCSEWLSCWRIYSHAMISAASVWGGYCVAIQRALARNGHLADEPIHAWQYQQLWYGEAIVLPSREPLLRTAISLATLFTRGGIGGFGMGSLLCCR